MAKLFIGEEAHWLYNFSMNLKEMVREKGLSAAKLSRMTGISDSTLRLYLRAMAMPTEDRVLKIAEALECDVRDLTEKEYDYGMPDEE